jgi:hypothetical protein
MYEQFVCSFRGVKAENSLRLHPSFTALKHKIMSEEKTDPVPSEKPAEVKKPKPVAPKKPGPSPFNASKNRFLAAPKPGGSKMKGSGFKGGGVKKGK